MFVPTLPPPGPPSPSPKRFQGRGPVRSLLDDSEVDELLLREAGDDGVEDSVDEPALRAARAAAAGLQCAQMKMVNPRPLQLVQIAPLW